MERTIPIYRALIASDREGAFHRNHAGLGYALTDKTQPERKATDESLTQAIAIRGNPEAEGCNIYEFNRACCRIQLDPSFAGGSPSSAETRAVILADLCIAYRQRWVRSLLQDDPTILKWLAHNAMNVDSLSSSWRG